MAKKTNLINSLKVAIEALKNDTIHYSWNHQESCNCGVVSQAILGKTATDIKMLFSKVAQQLTAKKIDDKTWKSGIKYLCPITGKSNFTIFNDLFDAGLSKSDIVHLEYMENEAILTRSGIKTTKTESTTNKEVKTINKKTIEVKHPNFFKRLFGKTILQDVEDVEYHYVTTTTEKPIDYYKNQENLILYLQAWVDILEEGQQYKSTELADLSTDKLEAELLVAVAEEQYEYAAEIRDNINKNLLK